MSEPIKSSLSSLALSLDQIPTERFENAANAIQTYEAETDDWCSEKRSEADEEGIELEEDEAYWEEYDEYCDGLRPSVMEETGATTDDFDLLMTASSEDWEGICEKMKNEANRQIFIELCNSI